MADLSSAGRSCYGRAQRGQIPNDRQHDTRDPCYAKINLVQHDEPINYFEDRRRDKGFADLLQNLVDINSAEQQQY